MTKIILDKPTMERLQDLRLPLALCDENGLIRGHFIPTVDPESYRKIAVPFSEEDLDIAQQEQGGRPLAEILKDLNVR